MIKLADAFIDKRRDQQDVARELERLYRRKTSSKGAYNRFLKDTKLYNPNFMPIGAAIGGGSGLLLGGTVGALASDKNKLRNAILGGLLTGVLGAGAGAYLGENYALDLAERNIQDYAKWGAERLASGRYSQQR